MKAGSAPLEVQSSGLWMGSFVYGVEVAAWLKESSLCTCKNARKLV